MQSERSLIISNYFRAIKFVILLFPQKKKFYSCILVLASEKICKNMLLLSIAMIAIAFFHFLTNIEKIKGWLVTGQ